MLLIQLRRSVIQLTFKLAATDIGCTALPLGSMVVHVRLLGRYRFEARALAPVLWLTHGAPSECLTVRRDNQLIRAKLTPIDRQQWSGRVVTAQSVRKRRFEHVSECVVG